MNLSSQETCDHLIDIFVLQKSYILRFILSCERRYFLCFCEVGMASILLCYATNHLELNYLLIFKYFAHQQENKGICCKFHILFVVPNFRSAHRFASFLYSWSRLSCLLFTSENRLNHMYTERQNCHMNRKCSNYLLSIISNC